MNITVLIRPSDVKIKPIMFYEGMMPKFPGALAIAVVVTSRSSSFEYTISVHAVNAGAEINVCNIVSSTKTPKPPPIHLKRCSRVQHTTPALLPIPPQALPQYLVE